MSHPSSLRHHSVGSFSVDELYDGAIVLRGRDNAVLFVLDSNDSADLGWILVETAECQKAKRRARNAPPPPGSEPLPEPSYSVTRLTDDNGSHVFLELLSSDGHMKHVSITRYAANTLYSLARSGALISYSVRNCCAALTDSRLLAITRFMARIPAAPLPAAPKTVADHYRASVGGKPYRAAGAHGE